MQIVKVKETEKTGIGRWFDVFISNKYFIILLCCLIVGMFFGAICVKHLNTQGSEFVDKWFDSFVKFRLSSGLWQIFFKSFLTGFIYLVVICLSSFGLSGIPVFPLLMLFRGFGTCMLAGLLYKNCSLQGVAFADLILLPSCVALDFVLVYFSSRAMEQSFNFLSVFKGSVQNVQLLKSTSLDLMRRCLMCMLTVVISSFVESVFTVCFSDYFNLM